MKNITLTLVALCALAAPAFAQNGKSPFCDEVNAARKSCMTARYDCSFMMGDLKPDTLDTIDQIKSCPPYDAAPPTPGAQSTPDIGKLVCCLSPSK